MIQQVLQKELEPIKESIKSLNERMAAAEGKIDRLSNKINKKLP